MNLTLRTHDQMSVRQLAPVQVFSPVDRIGASYRIGTVLLCGEGMKLRDQCLSPRPSMRT
jgi:hypothetical protein